MASGFKDFIITRPSYLHLLIGASQTKPPEPGARRTKVGNRWLTIKTDETKK